MDQFALKDLIAALTAARPVDIAKPAVVPNGYTLTDTEQFRNAPDRWRHTFRTSSLTAYLAYLREFATDDSLLLVDPDNLAATCIIDHGASHAPRWGSHRATLTLARTPVYDGLRTLCASAAGVLQESVVDFVLDWTPHLAFSAAPVGEPWADMPIPAAVAALRKLTIQTGSTTTTETSDTAAQKSLLARAAIASEPPQVLRVRAAPYEELIERDLFVRLTYVPKDPPLIRARLLESGQLQRDLAAELQERLQPDVPDLQTFIGTLV